MKILLSNYRYFISGGPERYMFNVKKELESCGHEVMPFSIDYKKNQSTPYSKYFVSPIGNREQIYFDQHKKSFRTYFKTISRLFYSPEVKKNVTNIIRDQQSDIAYVLHYLRKLSPSLIAGLKKNKLPIVVRISDYAMLCPQAHCLRDGVPCTLCTKGALRSSVKYKCVKGSFSASLINSIATHYHRKKKFFDLIDTFVCTNQFMYNMMAEAGYPESKLVCIPTFTDTSHFSPTHKYAKKDYIAYCGRLTEIKGIHTLLDAYALLKKKGHKQIKLKIAGTGDKQYLQRCQQIISENDMANDVELLGEVRNDNLPEFLAKALFSVIPSLCFENLPNSMLESMACGTPVIVSDIGSLSPCVDNGSNGLLFKPGNPNDLAEKMSFCLDNTKLLSDMARQAHNEALDKYSPDKHITALTQLFTKLIP